MFNYISSKSAASLTSFVLFAPATAKSMRTKSLPPSNRENGNE